MGARGELFRVQPSIFAVYTLALFAGVQIGRNAKFSLALINNKCPLRVDPGGHHFLLLKGSINKTAVFVSEVVTYKKKAP